MRVLSRLSYARVPKSLFFFFLLLSLLKTIKPGSVLFLGFYCSAQGVLDSKLWSDVQIRACLGVFLESVMEMLYHLKKTSEADEIVS